MMNMLFNPCRCDCETGIVKTELVFVMKKYSPQKKNSQQISANHANIAPVAMEPKHIEVKTRNLYLQRRPSNLNDHQIQLFLSNQLQLINEESNYEKKTCEKNAKNQSILYKFTSKQSNNRILMNSKKPDQKCLKEKVMNFSSQQETQRKTMKRYNNPLKNRKQFSSDITSTARRFKNKQNTNNLQSPDGPQKKSPKTNQIFLRRIEIQAEKQNMPISRLKDFQNRSTNQNSQVSIKLMNEEISILRNQLKRLQDDEKKLLIEKSQNQRFFAEDYTRNERKKENLKQNCQQRSEELKELKNLLSICKNRFT